jgi:uncharacterized membrane protein YqjE
MKLNNKLIGWVCLGIVLVFSLYLFQFTGLRTLLGMLIVFVAPSYFTLFLSLSLFTLVVWLVDRIIPSLRVSLVVSVVLVSCAGIFWKKLHKSRKHSAVKEG